ncbi:uncharacterized protein LOC126677863 isoform X2 [Mercurialis annua]|uniref:uncharacterized protein LOC126677863 isoform X2 n=1 Tax=Mercurialis annua TaxID=3986 RepID=UPI00215DF5AB|nr:uncharacterized protein LOC126677863 isoform X2 [Mercurialis annua]
MDWDLWSAPEESWIFSLRERPCDFYFGYGFDVMEEDALNEKYCLQVLRRLIENADTEIDNLEQDLISLQNEMGWINNEDWFEICCDSLREKINCLDVSIKSLTNKDKNDVEVHLLRHTKPVETLKEIFKDLLSNNLHKKDEQPEEVKYAVSLSTTSDAHAPREPINIMGENEKKGSCNSKSFLKEGMKGSSFMTDNVAVLNPSLKLQGRKTNNQAIIKPANVGTAAGHSTEEILPGNSSTKNLGKGEDRKYGFILKDQRMIQSSSSKSADSERCRAETIKIEPTDVGISNSISVACGNFSTEKKSSNSGSSTVSGEIEEHSSICSYISLGPSIKPEVKKTDPRKKLANAIVKRLGQNRQATGSFNEMKTSGKSNSKVSGNKGFCSRPTEKRKPLSPSINTEGKQTCPRKHEHADFVKTASAEELKCTPGLYRRKENDDSGFSSSSNSDIKQKICIVALKAASKGTAKDSKVASLENVVSVNLYPKVDRKEKSPLRIRKVVETAVTETENCALTSLSEPREEGKDAIRRQPKEEGKTTSEEHICEVAADETKSNSKPSLISLKEKVKRSNKSNLPILYDVSISRMVDGSCSSIISKAKKRKLSVVSPLNAGIYQDCKTTAKKLVELRECASKRNSHSSGDVPKSAPMKILSSDKSINESSYKDDPSLFESSICDSSSNSALLLPSALTLEKMRLGELRDMAKRYKISKYYNLSKKTILQQLAGRMDD